MRYFIRQRGGKITIGVKRLKDFRGVEGYEYFVHTRKDKEPLDCIPIYVFTNAKLKKTDSAGLFLF